MSINRSTILKVFGRKAATIILVAGSAASAFAVLGDGKNKNPKNRSLLSNQTISAAPGKFSLKSGYSFRGSQVISSEKKYINLNTVVTYQKGKTTYFVPFKKKIFVSGGNAGVIFNH
jgi:hypothetical protein